MCTTQGAHVSVNARTEDDVDEKSIVSRVAKASGANYSFHKEKKQAMPAVEPVVCAFLCFISPPVNDSFRKDLCFSPDVFLKIFSSDTRSPRCVGRSA